MANSFGVAEHYEADLLGYSAQHELRLLVEVQAGRYWAAKDLTTWTDEDWEDFFQEETSAWFPSSNKPTTDPRTWTTPWFFLLVTPRQTALWQPGASHWRRPDYIIATITILDKRIDTQRFPLETLDTQQLAGTVHDWLLLTQFATNDKLSADPKQSWLVASGLYAAIYRGDIVQQAT